MKGVIIPFWPGLLLAFLVRVGPWVLLSCVGFMGEGFYSGIFAGIGVVMAATSLQKLINELRVC